MAGPIELTSADFLEIKQALIEYIESTNILPGCNFEGTNIQVILDTLAYQQQLNAYTANMVSNESFLESAVVRKNVVSGAKQIGYAPVSARSSKTHVDFEFQLMSATYPSGFPSTVTLQPGMAFTTSNGKNSHIFNCVYNQTAPVRSDGLVHFKDVEVFEGVYLTAEFTVDENDFDQRFILQNQNIDTTTVRVEVAENPAEDERTFYSQTDNLVILTEESRKYFVEECDNGYYELVFGDDLFGYKPKNGSVIYVTYLVSTGPLANGINAGSAFKFVGTAIDSYGNRIIERATINSADTTFGGASIESIASIKYRAPREFAAQNRCVVAEDYDTLVRRVYPPTADVYVFGGETLKVPEYGRVYIAIKPTTGKSLPNITKNYIKKSLDPYRVASLDIKLVDPDILYVEIDSSVFYNEKKTIKDSASVKATVYEALNRYVESTAIPKFGGALKYSNIIGIIDDADRSITRNNTTFKMRKDLEITPNTFATYQVDFKQDIDVQRDEVVLHSSGFQLELEGVLDERIFYFENDPKTIRYETNEDETTESLVSDIYCFYFNEFFEKVRVGFYRNKFNELIVVDVVGDDQEATPFGIMSFKGKVDLGFKFENGINFAKTVESGNIVQIRVKPKNQDIFAEESMFLELDVSRSNIDAIVDKKIAGS